MQMANTPALLLLDLPPSALAGIDLLTFTTTPRFKGVKNLPPGLHFTYVGSSAAFSERHGVWFSTQQQQLTITRWDPATETLRSETDRAEHARWKARLGSIWRDNLTPYRQSAPTTTISDDGGLNTETVEWASLASAVSDRLLSRITTGDAGHWSLSSTNSAKRDLDDIPGLSNDDIVGQAERELHFLPVDLKQTWREGAIGRERTEAAQDRSWTLNNLLQTQGLAQDSTDIIGELQFCFLMVLTINNFSCLEQWKRLLVLLFTCKASVVTRPNLYVKAIATLRVQLQHCKLADNGLIDLADESGSLLKDLLSRFRKGLEQLETLGSGLQDVIEELDDLENFLEREYGWQFGKAFVKSGILELMDGEQVHMDTTAFDEDDETGEYAPQVVDLTPNQARMLNIDEVESLRTSPDNRPKHKVESSEDEDEEEGDEGDDHESDDGDARY